MVNQYWRPQHDNCPLCTMNFTVISRFEEMDEDIAYFYLKANLTKGGKQTFQDVRNPSYTEDELKLSGMAKDVKYWEHFENKEVEMMLALYDYDLKFFGYSSSAYFKAIGLEKFANLTANPEFINGQNMNWKYLRHTAVNCCYG